MGDFVVRTSLVAQTGKASAYNAEDPGSIPWVGKVLWRRKWQSHGWRSVVGYSPWGHKESDTTERLHLVREELRIL